MDGKEVDGRDLRVDIARHDRPQPCEYLLLQNIHFFSGVDLTDRKYGKWSPVTNFARAS